MFDRFGSITSYGIVSGIALLICIIHIIVNQLIKRYCKDDNFKENTSSTINRNAVGDVNDSI